jgi:hypothetical protein
VSSCVLPAARGRGARSGDTNVSGEILHWSHRRLTPHLGQHCTLAHVLGASNYNLVFRSVGGSTARENIVVVAVPPCRRGVWVPSPAPSLYRGGLQGCLGSCLSLVVCPGWGSTRLTA